MPLRNTFLHLGILAPAAALTLAGCKPKVPPAHEQPPAAVEIVTVKAETIPLTQNYIGRGVSPYDVELRALVSGTLKERPMTDGDKVKAGDTLFVLDDTPFKAALENAKARVVQSEVALDNARRNLERLKPLIESKAISPKDFDDAGTAVLAAKAQLTGARADVTAAQWNLDNTRIIAPVSGNVGKAMVVPGAPIAANTTILVRLQQTDPIWVEFSIPETTLLRFNKGVSDGHITDGEEKDIRVDLTLSDGATYPIPGKLNFKDVNLRTEVSAMQARASFANPDHKLKPGQFFTVRLSGPKQTGVHLLPKRSVQINPTDKHVYVVSKDNRAEVRSVKAGEWLGERWIIEEGLKDGDRVIVDGLQRIAPGAPVTVTEGAPKTDAKPAPAPVS